MIYTVHHLLAMGDLMERGGGGFLIFFRWKGGRGGLSEGGGLFERGGSIEDLRYY